MRPSWPDYFTDLARMVSTRSTCCRQKHGAVIVKDKQILSTGFNGAPSGVTSCNESGHCEREKRGAKPGEHYEWCLAGATVIKLLNGTYRTIEDLAKAGEDIWVYAVDTATGTLHPALATRPRQTGIHNDLVRVTFDNGATLECTQDHRIMMRDCTYREAGTLRHGDSLMPMFNRILKEFPSVEEAFIAARQYNHKVVSVEAIEGEYPVYDLTVPKYENFAVALGDNSCVFVHNCVALHAEQNAIIQAAKHGIAVAGATMYVTGVPCLMCARAIINAGIAEVIFIAGERYNTDETTTLLTQGGVHAWSTQAGGRENG